MKNKNKHPECYLKKFSWLYRVYIVAGRRYKQSILVSDQSTKEYLNINFAQWSADNVDHNIAILTGHGNFHGMGIVETATRGEIKLNVIKRLNDRKLIDEVINNCGKVPIVQYT